MKNLSKSVLLGAALCLAPFVSTQAQSTWQTVDDFQYSPGVGTVGRAVTVASDGSVYRLAYGGDASGANHSVLHRSTDGGTTWTPLLNDTAVNLMCLAEGAGGVLWTAGQTIGSAAGTWLTYRSTDGGVSWGLVDQLSFPKGTVPNALAADAAGRVFVCGRGVDAKGATRWIVRRTLDGGATWSTSDNFIVGSVAANALGIAITPAGVVVVAGQSGGGWTVRRSTNGGSSWTTAETFKSGTIARDVTADGAGNLYVTGTANMQSTLRRSTDGGVTWRTVDAVSGFIGMGIHADAFGRVFVAGSSQSPSPLRWTVRGSTDSGATWMTTDVFTLAADGGSARRVASDASGNVFVVGLAPGADGKMHSILRKLPTP